jgi:hypothetical protein
MTHQCNKGHSDLKRSTALIPGHTINYCVICGSYNVDGTPWWPTAELSNPTLQKQLCQFADERQELDNRMAEFLGSPIENPRWEQLS